ncbi:MAG: hypothetical protein ACOC5U_00890 [Candidatus Aminicenantaceae bacterium]
MRKDLRWKKRTAMTLAGVLLLIMPSPAGEIIDGVAAVVNQEIITLTDVRIVRAFGLFEGENETGEDNRWVLKKLIERKLLIQLAGDSSRQSEVDAYMDGLKSRIGEDMFRRRLQYFSMTAGDLREYAAEAVLHQRILAERFSQAVAVNLKEMENYYQEIYLPSLKEGQKHEAMMDILDEIESAIRQEKIRSRVEEWMENLKASADIQVYADDYPEFFKQSEGRQK